MQHKELSKNLPVRNERCLRLVMNCCYITTCCRGTPPEGDFLYTRVHVRVALNTRSAAVIQIVCLFDTNTGFAYESAIAEQWYFSHSKYNCVIQSVFMHFLWYSVYSNIAILTSLLFRVALCVFFFQHASDQSSSTEDTTSDASPAAGTPKRMKP